MKKVYSLILVIAITQSGWCWNLWQDIQLNTNWDLGSNAAVGTAIALKSNDTFNVKAGQLVGSALAEISDYRFLSVWGGGNSITQADGSTKLLDTGKVGFNLAYFLRGFKNQPPAIIRNLVIGPSLSTTIVTTPHVFIPFFDINYRFGQSPTSQQATPSIPPTGMLRLMPSSVMIDLDSQKG